MIARYLGRTLSPHSVKMNFFLSFVASLSLIASLSGCASYQAAPLPKAANLAPGLAALSLDIPATGSGTVARRIDVTRPLSIDEVGLLAMLNNPELKTERGVLGVARAGLVQATYLPNPSVNLGYGALLGGPGTASSIAASLSQDIAAIVTRGARIESAAAHLDQVGAEQLWREWQVAQKARQLAVDIHSADRTIRLTRRLHRLLLDEVMQVEAAVARGNLTVAALAPLSRAVAAAERTLRTLRLMQQKNWQALDAMLGVVPSVRFDIAKPVFGPLPVGLAKRIADLPDHRPDLVGLRLGYRSAEADVRAAILGQFPAFTLGASYGSDTSKVVSAGPSFTFALPVFDRNEGNIERSRASRELLREQYQARLDSAAANIHALAAQLDQFAGDLIEAHKAADAAATLAATARQAYTQGNLDQRSLTDYETTAVEREVEVVEIERHIAEDRIFLAVELGLDLPPMRIAFNPVRPL